jgi:Zn-dependent M28 family amino/carboxypeptidase
MMLNYAALALLALGSAAVQAQPSPIQASAILEDVRVLSSDSFQGRGPGERGETMTLAFLQAQFEAAGLLPGGPDGSWYQEVPLTRFDRTERSFELRIGSERLPLERARDWTIAEAPLGRTQLVEAPLLFVGFGIHAPEVDWDDYAGIDLRGRVAVMLYNDPDWDQETGPFGGRALSAYGRRARKVQFAFERGAAGVILVYQPAVVSASWRQPANSDPDPTWRLQSAATPAARPGLQLMLREEPAAELFRRTGHDLAALSRQAQQRGFRAVPLGSATMSAGVSVTATHVITRNIIARLDGTSRRSETVIFGAHWDAYGLGPPDERGDTIRNGAIDNGIGTATLLEVARAFARAPRTERSLLFIGFTAEEDGLLGAYHYTANPVRPLGSTAAMFNLDPHLALPRTKSIELIGAGRTDLEDDLSRVAAGQGLRIEPEVAPEAGWYRRSDHLAFAEAGVPVVYFRAGRDLETGGSAIGNALVAAYNNERYHQRNDEFDTGWDMAAAAQEGALAYALGREIADSGRWPSWLDNAEYRGLRQRSARERR